MKTLPFVKASFSSSDEEDGRCGEENLRGENDLHTLLVELLDFFANGRALLVLDDGRRGKHGWATYFGEISAFD